jgi:membrane protease YdiL (CAAX protease family)
MSWLRLGRLSAGTVATTLVVMALTSLVLLALQAAIQPNLRSYRDALPFEALGNVAVAGVVFSIVNATLEEVVFRGILFDAVRSQWGVWITLISTAVLFGVGHWRGYPPGALGACLAGVFGFVMGVLRLWSCGLILPILAHVAADATIYCILVRSGIA